jgi:hypothetical protein
VRWGGPVKKTKMPGEGRAWGRECERGEKKEEEEEVERRKKK